MCYMHSSVWGWECKRSLEPVPKASLSLRAVAVVGELQRFVTLGGEALGRVGQKRLVSLARQLCHSSRDQASSEAGAAPCSAFPNQPWWVQGQQEMHSAVSAKAHKTPPPCDDFTCSGSLQIWALGPCLDSAGVYGCYRWMSSYYSLGNDKQLGFCQIWQICASCGRSEAIPDLSHLFLHQFATAPAE